MGKKKEQKHTANSSVEFKTIKRRVSSQIH